MNQPDLFERLARPDRLFFHQPQGIVGICGPDSRAFLQKMSTNDLAILSPKNPLPNCLVDNKGRLVDFIYIFETAQDEFLLISSHTSSHPLMEWLSSYQFIEDFSINNLDQKYGFQWQVTSAQSSIESADMLTGHFFRANYAQVQLDFWGQLDLKTHLRASHGDDGWWQTLRIAAGIPHNPQEICSKFMPQNVGLQNLIANNKGCYIGQEVVAKAITYQKNPKFLAGVSLSHEDYLSVQVGDEILSPTGHLGLVSSRAPLYWPQAVNALVIADAKPTRESLHAGQIQAPFQPFCHKYPVAA